jgi:hypothetical protein
VAVPPREYFDGFLHSFEQAETKDPDLVIYDIRKFIKLAADANPSVMEVLWVDTSDRLICTPAGQRLIDNRDAFLSKKVLYTYRGYAQSQLKRIQTHRSWLLHPKEEKPTRKEFGLPEYTVIPGDQLAAALAAMQKKVDSWEIDFGDMSEASKIYVQEQLTAHLTEYQLGADDKYQVAGRLLGYEANFLEALSRERQYAAAFRGWQQYQEWKQNRNPKRAVLEAKYGFDAKFAMHLVRLLRECREILTEGTIHVRRPDAAELLAIRNGAWSYDYLMSWAAEQDAELWEMGKASSLPHSPDRVALDKLCQEIVQSMQEE